MKKVFITLLIAAMNLALIGCGSKTENEESDASVSITEDTSENTAEENKIEADTLEETDLEAEESEKQADPDVDLDLTALSSTMVYSEVFNMIMDPEAYTGQTIKMDGNCSVFTDEETGKTYYACIVKDATACCSQGLEFVLDESLYTAADYPADGDEITIKGTFSSYNEGEYMYITMLDSVME